MEGEKLFRTYIVGGIDHAAQDKKLLDQIRDKQLRTAFEATKAQGKLQEDLNKYKDSLNTKPYLVYYFLTRAKGVNPFRLLLPN